VETKILRWKTKEQSTDKDNVIKIIWIINKAFKVNKF